MLQKKLLIILLFLEFLNSISLQAGNEENFSLLEQEMGYSALHEAAARGDLDRIKELLAVGTCNKVPLNRMTPLHIAARFGRIETLRWLLADGRFFAIDIDRRNALHTAAQYGQIGAMRVLLQDMRFVEPDAD